MASSLVYTWKASPWSSHAKLLSSLPQDGKGRRVLDVGCGDGYLGERLAARGYNVTGVEREGGYSSQFPATVQLIPADLEHGLPPLPAKYDYILCADILEHLRQPEMLLAQLRDALAPGGALIASLPNSGNFWFRGNIMLGRFPQDEKGLFDRTHVRFYMWRGWHNLLSAAGLRISQVEVTPVPVSVMVPGQWESSFPVGVAESVFYGLARLWKQMFAYQFIVRAER